MPLRQLCVALVGTSGGLEHSVTNITGLSNVQLRQQGATAEKHVDGAASKRRTSQCDRGDSRTDGQCDSVAKLNLPPPKVDFELDLG